MGASRNDGRRLAGVPPPSKGLRTLLAALPRGAHRLDGRGAVQPLVGEAGDVARDGVALEDAALGRLERRHLEGEWRRGRASERHGRGAGRERAGQAGMSARTFPSGFSFRNAGVLLVTPI